MICTGSGWSKLSIQSFWTYHCRICQLIDHIEVHLLVSREISHFFRPTKTQVSISFVLQTAENADSWSLLCKDKMLPHKPAANTTTFSVCCPFHAARCQSKVRDPLTISKTVTSTRKANKVTSTSSPTEDVTGLARTSSQRLPISAAGTTNKLKKQLFGNSSSGSSIDGAPAHPLTISVSSSSLVDSKPIQPDGVLVGLDKKPLPESDDRGEMMASPDDVDSIKLEQPEEREPKHPVRSIGASRPALTKASSIDQPATAGDILAAAETVRQQAVRRTNGNVSSPGFWQDEIKGKLRIEGPGLKSGNIIKKSPLNPLTQPSGHSYRPGQVDVAELASLSRTLGILSANAVSSNGGTLPQVPSFPSSHSICSQHENNFVWDILPGDVSVIDAAVWALKEKACKLSVTMRSPVPLQRHYSSPMYQPAAHFPLNPDNDAVKVLNSDDGYVYLNQYKLSNETLGHGTYSIVKLAYNTEDNTHYAMKILSKKKLIKKHRLTRRSGDPMQEAYREIAILKKLNHPNIIRLIEVLDDPSEDSLYMVFELLERGEVLVIPTEHPLTEPIVRRLFRHLILGVEYLHYNGILHRDLKPSNLLMDDNGRLKIADFGLSHMFDGVDDLLSSTVGTPAFHAPEILMSVGPNTVRRTAGSNPASRSGSLSRTGSDSDGERMTGNRKLCSGVAMDVWSMGITLFSLVFGEVPFHDQFIVGLYNQIKDCPPVFPPDIVISDQLMDLILRLLEKDPAKRITVAEMRMHVWVTQAATDLLTPNTEENCKVQIHVTEEDILASVRSIPHLDTLILIKAMLKRGSFLHPFKKNDQDNRKGSLDSNFPVSKTKAST